MRKYTKMHILFEDRVNLRPHLIDWLKWLTEPSTELRINSAKQAIKGLEKLNSQEDYLVTEFIGNRVKVSKNRHELEILILPRGFDPSLIGFAGMLIGLYSSYFFILHSIF